MFKRGSHKDKDKKRKEKKAGPHGQGGFGKLEENPQMPKSDNQQSGTSTDDVSLRTDSSLKSTKTSSEQLQGSIHKDFQSNITLPSNLPMPYPLEVTQTSSLKFASPTNVGRLSATEQGTTIDGVVFTMDNENGTNVQLQDQPLNITKGQIEEPQKEYARLVRSKAEVNLKVI